MALVAVNWKPSGRQLRQFALVGAAALLGLAAWLYFGKGWPIYAWSLATIGAGLGICGASCPESVRHLYLALIAVTYPIGWVISHVILGVIYYGLFTLVGLIFRLIGRDPLQRRFDRSATTYWQPRRPVTDVGQYFHQF